MDFFLAQEDARQRTGGLVSLLILVLAGVAFVVHSIGLLVSGGAFSSVEDHWRALPVTLPLAIGLMAAGVIARLYALRDGGAAIAEELGGYRVHPSSQNPGERRLLALVEELAVAAGIPVPEVWILQEEEAINAFVAGNDPSRAVVGVTRGALERLSREELQAVLAHEFSHILCGDMSLNFSLLAWVQGILFLTLVGSSMLRSGQDRDGGRKVRRPRRREAAEVEKGQHADGDSLPLLGVILVMCGAVFSVFGRIFQGAICRDRELFSDLASIGFTNNPAALVRALKKMGGMENGSLLMSPHASQVGHLFFGQAAVGFFSWMFPTHPPLEERIRQLEPDWSGDFLRSTVQPVSELWESSVSRDGGESGGAAFPGGKATFLQPQTFRIGVVEHFGQSFGPAHILQGAIAVRSLRPEWKALTLSRSGARKLVLELCKSAAVAELEMGKATPSQALLLMDLATPLLRRMAVEDYWSLMRYCRREVHRGEEVDVFRFLLAHVLGLRLGIALGLKEPQPVCAEELPEVWEEVRVLISLMVRTGSPTASGRRIAYGNAWACLPANQEALPEMLAEVTLYQIVSALNRVAQASALLKREILGALGVAASYGEEIRERELVLIRLIAESLGAHLVLPLRPNVG